MAKKSKSLIESNFPDIDFSEYEDEIPKTNTRKPKKTKKKESEVVAQPEGLKGVKKMLQDQVEIGLLQQMANGNTPKSAPPKPEVKSPPKTATPPNPFGMGMNPLMMMQGQNGGGAMDPQQMMAMTLMSNPQTAMLYMLMSMQNKNNTTEDVSNLKDLAGVMTALRGAQPQPDQQQNQMMMMIMNQLLKQQSQPAPQSDAMIKMMQMQNQQFQQQMAFWQKRATEAEQNANQNPISSLLQYKEELDALKGVFGNGSPMDEELKKANLEFQMLAQKREWDMQERAQERQLEAKKSERQLNLLQQGLQALTNNVITPMMSGVKAGLVNNPNAFESVAPALPDSPAQPEPMGEFPQSGPVEEIPIPDPFEPSVELPSIAPLKMMGQPPIQNEAEQDYMIPNSNGARILP